MSAAPWIKWYSSDFLNGVSMLGPTEGWVYTVVLNMIYDTGGPIKDDPKAIGRRCNMRPTSCEAALRTLQEERKILREGGLIWNKRAEKEIESRRKLGEKSSENARSRWQKSGKKANKNNDASMRTHSDRICEADAYQKPEARYQKPDDEDKSSSGAGARDPFEIWWDRYPEKVAKSRAVKAYADALDRGAKPDELLAGLDRYIATKPPNQSWSHAANWLNGGRWTDDPAPSPASSSTRGRNGLGEGQSAPEAAAPFGIAWGAARMASLLAGPTGPEPQLTKIERMLVERGEWTAEQLIADKRVTTGWPDVNAMHDRAEGRCGTHVAPRFAAMREAMERIPVGAPVFEAWRAHHASMGWPWIPEPGSLREVWFPRGGPAGLAAFEAAVAAEGAGR